MKDISELLNNFKIHPHNISLYELAFTHGSLNVDAHTKHHDYQRLEFLGDSVLGCIVAELAYKARPDFDQGDLTKLKISLVNTNALANFAKEYNFQDYIRVGNSFGGNILSSPHLLEDVFEAFLGALYLDQGFVKVRKFLISTLYKDIQKYDVGEVIDYKSKLQEEIQSEHRESVKYSVIKTSGPAHAKHFVVQVSFEGVILGVGEGSSKKEAEKNAAKEALKKKAGR